MFDEKNQKPQPSTYGSWKKISIQDIQDSSSQERQDRTSLDNEPSQKPHRKQKNPPNDHASTVSSTDDDLKKLDEILRRETLEQEQHQQGKSSGLLPGGPVTFEEDESLSALDSIITDIKQKTIQEAGKAETVQPKKERQHEPFSDVVSLLQNDPRIDVSKLEDLLSSQSEDAQPDSELSIEEAEEEFLKSLEQRYGRERNS